MKTVKIGEFIDAIEKNGLPQTFDYYFETKDEFTNFASELDGPITSVCAIGQACINLSILPENSVYRKFDRMMERAMDLNDSEHLSFEKIAEQLREEYRDSLDAIAEFEEFDYSEYIGEVL